MSRTSLVIVESPAKCKKIESFLGGGYKVIATYGHFRKINGLDDIHIDKNFLTKFSLIDDKIKLNQIEKLRSEINSAFEVILACDGDREGEGICWHICDLFGLSIEKTKRIIFHEITETAIINAVRNPGRIDMNLVHAQHSRQILDMLVGYTVTPILWNAISKKYDNSLSAGRCQSPALRLVYDNYLDIQRSPGKKVYNTIGYFTNLNLEFELNKQYETNEEINEFYKMLPPNQYIYSLTQPKKVFKKPPEPLTTSSLQQLVSNQFHWSPKETMKYAQQLYENGYITYMRTDSKKYSKEFIESTKNYIENNFGKEYVSASIDHLSLDFAFESKEQTEKKGKKANKSLHDNALSNNNSILVQEAHESIRPVKITISKDLLVDVDSKAVKLYELIWSTSLQSCMPSAQYNSVTAKISAPNDTYFSRKAEHVLFLGWQIADKNVKNDSKEYQYFLNLKPNINLPYKKIESTFNLIELKSHFTEARLVQILEENGIGRPSTYASLVDKIQERKYVEKKNIEGREMEGQDFIYENDILTTKQSSRIFGTEKNKLVIQPIGIIVIEYLIKYFDSFFNYDYTKNMESELDIIAKGNKEWTTLCNACYNDLSKVTNGIPSYKYNIKIDEQHSVIIGKFGPVVKCIDSKENVSFLPLKKGLDITLIEKMENIKLEDIIEQKEIAQSAIGKYKGKDLYVKKGKYGIYAQWDKETRSLKEAFSHLHPSEIQYIDVIRFLDKDTTLDPTKPIGLVRELTKELSIRTGKYGNYIYYKKYNARKPEDKKPKFFKLDGFKDDCKTCDKDLLVNWINQMYFSSDKKEVLSKPTKKLNNKITLNTHE
jgi:DNA topoisomerase-1